AGDRAVSRFALVVGVVLACSCAAQPRVQPAPRPPDPPTSGRDASSGDAAGRDAVGIIAEVNGQPVTRHDLEEALALDDDWNMFIRSGMKGGETKKQKIKQACLDRI